ncbi:helix-turn-helix domain-containing protein [Kineococcus sp. T13]|uniref:helix-turn-helix domain-containing protein n=1 Tax=Kineococcus vitellinus TaxID=2696565 RepID=UPI00141208BB|nr:helix-turn-helix transcriptional regulator [Kineococcus vitellinus]NAZ75950.1 helix-turn-helix domain-containing protein [Kineococcus vitellinus]
MSAALDSGRPPVGALVRTWRRRRRLSQLDLSCACGVSTRHLSFVETGRSRPGRQLLLRLAEQLDVPPRARNDLLLAAGYAPQHPEHRLADAPMAPVRQALELLLAAYEPFPALVVDRCWTLVAANRSTGLLTAGAAGHLLEPPVNVLRLSLHPDGLAPRITNLAQWRSHLLHRLARDAAATADPVLARLHEELAALPGGSDPDAAPEAVVVPLRIRHDGQELVFLSTVTTFGTAVDLTAAELSIETFLPADARTAAATSRCAGTSPADPGT